jgi:protein-tyrosine phosphatase
MQIDMIDFHCHLLPGLDDGPDNIDESVEMAIALQKAGFTNVYCTPHLIRGVYEANNEEVHASLDALQTRLNKNNIGLRLFPGREHYLDEFLFDYLKNPMPLGKTNFIMLEIPRHIPLEVIKETCFRIKLGGFIPMIAHPERCRLFAMPQKQTSSLFGFLGSKRKTSGSKTKGTSLIEYLKDIGCAFQGNLGSFDALYGQEVQQTATDLKKNEVFTHFGTDAHSLQGITCLNFPQLAKVHEGEHR